MAEIVSFLLPAVDAPDQLGASWWHWRSRRVKKMIRSSDAGRWALKPSTVASRSPAKVPGGPPPGLCQLAQLGGVEHGGPGNVTINGPFCRNEVHAGAGASTVYPSTVVRVPVSPHHDPSTAAHLLAIVKMDGVRVNLQAMFDGACTRNQPS